MSFARDAPATGRRRMYSPREGLADVSPRRRLPTDQPAEAEEPATIAHLERQRRFVTTAEGWVSQRWLLSLRAAELLAIERGLRRLDERAPELVTALRRHWSAMETR